MDATLELLQTDVAQADLVRNLYQFYAYESSDWEQEDVEVDGRFYIHEPHFERYWQSPGWSATLVLVDGFIAGFVLVERSELPGIDAFELADLFILKNTVARASAAPSPSSSSAKAMPTGCCAGMAPMPWRRSSARHCWPTCRAPRGNPLDDEPELFNYLVTPRRH